MYKLQKQRDINETLKKAAKAYYVDGNEIMSNFEYDKLYDELLELEKETGVVFSDSVTQNVGFEVMTELTKEKHPSKMLSLDKTKDREALKNWLGNNDGVLSFKLDGLTIVAHYNNGKLQKAVTRGNGTIGEIITHNAKFFKGLPTIIPFKEELVVRGEALMTYSEFDRINELILDETNKYKNPRNLASGTIRQLDSSLMKEREIDFYAFSLVSGNSLNSFNLRLDWLETQGFQVVKHKKVNKNNLFSTMDEFDKKVKTNDFPSDGLVLFFDDIAYGESLGSTSKFPRNGMAFKWKDEEMSTTLLDIEWSASRTGLLNPVAIFESVELEGTTVSRASLHNVSTIESLKLNIGDTISVYKANMIIPQISQNLTQKSSYNVSEILPKCCPVCGGKVNIEKNNDTRVLKCTNENCVAKHIGQFEHFVSRDATNIVGLSSSKLESLINAGILHELKDLYHIEKYMNEIVNMEGFGHKSYDNLRKNIEKSREIEPDHFLYALGISEIGRSASRDILKYLNNDFEKIFEKTREEFLEIDGVGEIMANNLVTYFHDNEKFVKELMKEFTFSIPTDTNTTTLSGLTFVITGKLHMYENRDELKNEIEKNGGKVSGSVSNKTDYLINNDIHSTSGKNKKAKELGVKIITEEEFEEMF